MRRLVLSAVTAAVIVAGWTAGTPVGATSPAWTARPSAGPVGAAIAVASGPGDECQWVQPVQPGSTDLVHYDGTRVELRLRGAAIVALGQVPVGTGGAWSGTVHVPAGAVSGSYELVARCVVDDPALDGVRSYDFDPRAFAVLAPPTTTLPVEIPPPVVVTAAPPSPPSTPVPTKQARRRTTRSTAAAATLPNTGPELPNTGNGTLPVALAGLGALAIGGLALWWGGRTRPAPDRHPS